MEDVGGAIGSAVGGAVGGPGGAIVGALAGRLLVKLPDVAMGTFTNLSTDGLKWASKRAYNRLTTDDKEIINHDLQQAFRSAAREAVYDIGGAGCFTQAWQDVQRDGEADFFATPQGHHVCQTNEALAEQFHDCLRAIDTAIQNEDLLPIKTPVDDLASVQPYLEALTPQALNDQFFNHNIKRFLARFGTLFAEVPDLEPHLRRYLLKRTLVHFGEQLKQHTPAWRAYNRLMLESLRDSVQQIASGQDTIIKRLDAVLAQPNGQPLTDWSNGLADLINATGQHFEQHMDGCFDELTELVIDQNKAIVLQLDNILTIVQDLPQQITQAKEELSDNIKALGDKVQPVFTALHQIPAPVGDFVGRVQEIDDLVKALRQARGTGAAAAISGIQGMGGLGKTQLAYQVAARVADEFPGGHILLELGGASTPVSPERALQDALRAFVGAQAQLPDTLDDLRDLYLSQLRGERVLLVADDAKDKAQVEPLLPPAGCALLVTSRHRFSLSGMQPLDLPMLPPHEADMLLLKICSRIGPAAGELAKLCGYLPLALRISAELLADNKSISVEHHLRNLADTHKRLALMRAPDADPNDPRYSVEASINLSYDTLSHEAQQVLRQVSVFAGSFNRAAVEAVVHLPPPTLANRITRWLRLHQPHAPPALDDVLEKLERRSLLDFDPQTKRRSLHDLVRVFAAGHLPQREADRVYLHYVHHYAQVAEQADQLYSRGGDLVLEGLALFDTERPNIDAAWDWLRGQASSQVTDDLLIKYAIKTLNIGSLRYNMRTERIPQLEAAVVAARRRGQKSAEGSALNNLGNAYQNLGDVPQAIKYHEQALAISRAMGDRRGEGSALNNLGIDYAIRGEMPQAIACYEQQLAIVRAMGDQRGEGSALNNLGIAYRDLGKVPQAIKYHEQALAISRAMGDRRGEGNALGNLGIAYAIQSEVPQAIACYEQQLVIVRAMGDPRGEGNALGNLGLAYRDLGKVPQAIDCYRQQLAIAHEIGDRQGEVDSSWNWGELLAKQDDLEHAIPLMQRRIDYERKIEHADAEKNAAVVDKLRQRLAGDEGM